MSKMLFSQISRKLLEVETPFALHTYRKSCMYGLSFGAMTFDLGPWSKVKTAILVKTSKIMRDRESIWCLDL